MHTILFDSRAIVTAVALFMGLSTPPIFVSQTKLLLACSCSKRSCGLSSGGTGQQSVALAGNDFTLSLEWTLFNPSNRFCAIKHSESLDLVADDNGLLTDYTSDNICLKEDTLVCLNSSLHLDIFFIEISPSTEVIPLIAVNLSSEFPTCKHSVTSPFDHDLYNPLPGFDSELLLYHEQLRMHLREVVLSSLAAHWTEWITNNRPTLGLISVSVMYGSLLCPLLYYLWRQNKENKRLVMELTSTKQSMDLQVLRLTQEKDSLYDQISSAVTHSQGLEAVVNTHKQELLKVNQCKAQLEVKVNNVSNSLSRAQNEISQYQSLVELLEGEAQELREKMTKLSFEHSKLLNNFQLKEDELQQKSFDTKRRLERYELLEFEAQEKLMSTKEALGKERKEWIKTKTQLLTYIQSLTNQLELNKKRLGQYELFEFEAQEKAILAEEQLEKERKEWMKTEEQLCSVIESFTNRLKLNKCKTDKALTYIRATEQKLQLANREILEQQTRLSASQRKQCVQRLAQQMLPQLPTDVSIDTEDSGISELNESLSSSDEDSDTFVLSLKNEVDGLCRGTDTASPCVLKSCSLTVV